MLLLLGTLLRLFERIRRKFTALFHKRYIQGIQYHYYNLWEKLNFWHRLSGVVTLMFYFYYCHV
jgi:hypothetical protein